MTEGEKRILADAADHNGFLAVRSKSAIISRIRPDPLFPSLSNRIEQSIDSPITGVAS